MDFKDRHICGGTMSDLPKISCLFGWQDQGWHGMRVQSLVVHGHFLTSTPPQPAFARESSRAWL